MRAIEIAGDPGTIGRALGEEARSAVREAVLQSPTYGELSQWLNSARLDGLMAKAKEALPNHFAELEGIAAGAGASIEQIFLWNCRGDLHRLTRGADDCTTLCYPAAPGRPAIIAHNEDGGQELASLGFMARVAPASGLGFTAFCYPGMLPGHAFAVNDAGIVQTINNIAARDLTVGLPRHFVCRAILESANLNQALAWLVHRGRAAGFHHNLGEAANGDLLSVEAPASGCSVVEVTAPRAHANHLIHQDFADLEQIVSPSSRARQDRADALLAEQRGGPPRPLAILFDRENEALPILCRGETASGGSYTLATALFTLDEGRVGLEVFHGPDETPVFKAEIDTAARKAAE